MFSLSKRCIGGIVPKKELLHARYEVKGRSADCNLFRIRELKLFHIWSPVDVSTKKSSGKQLTMFFTQDRRSPNEKCVSSTLMAWLIKNAVVYLIILSREILTLLVFLKDWLIIVMMANWHFLVNSLFSQDAIDWMVLMVGWLLWKAYHSSLKGHLNL